MISLLNPHALLDTIGLIGTSSLGYSGSEKAAFTGACILVSWIWFLFLAAAGHVLGARDASGRLVGWLNKASAVVMWAAAVYLLLSL
jgi:L-lysine exporter family protein LysE/ArgO